MSELNWVLLAFALTFAVFVEAVRRILRQRLRRQEAALEQDFGAQMDRELPGLLEDEGQ